MTHGSVRRAEFMGQPSRLLGVHLSQLLRLPLLTRAGERVGPLEDVVVRLRAGGYPLVDRKSVV